MVPPRVPRLRTELAVRHELLVELILQWPRPFAQLCRVGIGQYSSLSNGCVFVRSTAGQRLVSTKHRLY